MSGVSTLSVDSDQWLNTHIGAIAKLIRGVTYKKEVARGEPEDGYVPILRATNIDSNLDFDQLVYVPRNNVNDSQLLQQGDIIIAASSGSRSVVGKSAPLRTDFEGSFGAFCYALRPSPDIDPLFLAYFMQTKEYRNYISALSAGVNINNLKREHIEQASIAFPPTLHEQRAIVEAIETQFARLDDAVAALQRTRTRLKRYRASVLKAACEGRLVPTEAELARQEGREYEPASVLLERIKAEREAASTKKGRGKSTADTVSAAMEDRGPLPAGWEWTTLGETTQQIGDVDHKMPKAQNDGIPYISTKDFFGENEIAFGSAKRISDEDYSRLARKIFPEQGDILMSRYGTIGEVRIVSTSERFQASYSVAIIKSLRHTSIARYLVHYLRSPECQAEIRSHVRASAQPDVGIASIRSLHVAIPPRTEQSRIVTEVERVSTLIDQMEYTVEASLKRAESLRQSILRQAFSGQLVQSLGGA